ncbi:MAG: penicillin-binding protein 2, partial [Candidatus Sungbacteria bacterium]|nr:penicillin-binding protein 2 [Candidatus Sungbacteria bacterium]
MNEKSFGKNFSWRFRFVFGLFLLLALIMLSRIFYIAVIKHDDYAAIAERQNRLKKILPAKRGSIFLQDRFGNEKIAAYSSDTYDLAVSPKSMEDPEDTAKKLAALFSKDTNEYMPKLTKPDDPFEIVEKNVSIEKVDAIDAAHIPTLTFLPSTQRVYPGGRLAASVLGFIGYKENEVTGLYGIERKYQKEMTGTAGIFEGEKDASGIWVVLGKRNVEEAVNGSDIVLTIDYTVQERLQGELSKVKEKWDAESGLAMVLEPKTGRILALATNPDFDPNEYFKEKNYQVFKNSVVESAYELGSVMKPVTMSAAINEGVLNPNTSYEDTGEVKIGGYTIQNFDLKAHGIQTMTQVLEKSLNTGVVFAEKLLGKEKFKKYIMDFGFGSPLGSDIHGELSGNISNLNFNRDIDYATASFGQGIAVTPLQMASAVSAIANHGMLMRPYI